jgi:Saxitoxin biosynthesis operon protein SxtJ
MALTGMNRNPSPADLRTFGRLLPVFVAGAGALVAVRSSMATAVAIWLAGGGLSLLYIAVAAARRPVFLAWTRATYPIGWTTSRLVMGVVFFLVITPVGLLVRRFGRDPLERTFDGSAPSYWVERSGETELSRYFRQF